MVRRGEYLERAVVIPGDAPLEGLYHRGRRDPPLVIVPPHPHHGGGMEGPIVAELAWALTRAGHATLRFNYPGIGASPGTFAPETGPTALETALEHLRASAAPAAPETAEVGGVALGWGFELLFAAAAAEPTRFGTLIGVVSGTWSPPAAAPYPHEVVLLVPQARYAELRDPLEGWLAALPRGRLGVIPGADAAFQRGLVELGRVAAETFDPPGLIDLG